MDRTQGRDFRHCGRAEMRMGNDAQVLIRLMKHL